MAAQAAVPPSLSYGSSGAASSRSLRIREPRPLLRPEYFPNKVGDPNRVRMYTTLRDREQQYPGAAFSTADKRRITNKLASIGVDIIEVGFPGYSSQEAEAVSSIVEKIGNKEYALAGQLHVPVICALSRCSKKDVAAAWEALQDARRPRINIFIPLDYFRLAGVMPDKQVAIVGGMVAYARQIGCPDIQFTVEVHEGLFKDTAEVHENAGRSERGFMYRILEEVIKAGATTLCISDTTGHTVPEEFGKLISDIKANVVGIQDVIISTHCFSNCGLATANTIAGACAGARQLEVAIIGTGNASLEKVVREIEYPRRQLGGLYTAIDSQLIKRINRMIKKCNGALIQSQIVTTGVHTFTQHAGGTHQISPW